MALLDCVYAARGMLRVWLLAMIFIWGVRKSKVQIPIQLTGSIRPTYKEKAISCLWEDE